MTKIIQLARPGLIEDCWNIKKQWFQKTLRREAQQGLAIAVKWVGKKEEPRTTYDKREDKKNRE